jgi:hypothetical protein
LVYGWPPQLKVPYNKHGNSCFRTINHKQKTINFQNRDAKIMTISLKQF